MTQFDIPINILLSSQMQIYSWGGIISAYNCLQYQSKRYVVQSDITRKLTYTHRLLCVYNGTIIGKHYKIIYDIITRLYITCRLLPLLLFFALVPEQADPTFFLPGPLPCRTPSSRNHDLRRRTLAPHLFTIHTLSVTIFCIRIN